MLKSNSLHSYPSSEREGKFVVARLSPPKKVKLGILLRSRAAKTKKSKKACCKCRVVVLPIQPTAFICRSRCRRRCRCGIFKRDVARDNSQRRFLA